MQTLSALLRCLANINLILAEVQHQKAKFAVLKRIKDATAFSNTDFADVANHILFDLEHCDDPTLSDADDKRLRAVAHNLRNCNQHLHLTQNLILSGDNA